MYKIVKNWKKMLLIGIIILIIGFICTRTFNLNGMENLANMIGTPLLYIAVTILVISLISYVITKKIETNHLPIWVYVVIVVTAIVVLSNIYSNATASKKSQQGRDEAIKEITEYNKQFE